MKTVGFAAAAPLAGWELLLQPLGYRSVISRDRDEPTSLPNNDGCRGGLHLEAGQCCFALTDGVAVQTGLIGELL